MGGSTRIDFSHQTILMDYPLDKYGSIGRKRFTASLVFNTEMSCRTLQKMEHSDKYILWVGKKGNHHGVT
jgi:hypothetical protein